VVKISAKCELFKSGWEGVDGPVITIPKSKMSKINQIWYEMINWVAKTHAKREMSERGRKCVNCTIKKIAQSEMSETKREIIQIWLSGNFNVKCEVFERSGKSGE
jgi:hypothetical protein